MIEIVKTNHRDGWIPITEQEPPEGYVLVTFKHREDDYEVAAVNYGVIKTWKDDKHSKIMRNCAKETASKIIAWMPMPEPYKED